MLTELSGLNFPRSRENTVQVCNTGNRVLHAYEPAFVVDTMAVAGEWVLLFKAQPGECGTSEIWGIVQSDIAPGATGQLQIGGLCRAFVRSGVMGEMVEADSSGGLAAAGNGTAYLLHPGSAEVPGLVILRAGGTASGGYVYDGTFKVSIGSSSGTLLISAGETDLNGYHTVEPSEINYNSGDRGVYFCATFTENGFYNIFCTTDANTVNDSIPELCVKLANLYYNNRGELYRIDQVFHDYKGIFFGGRYLL